jgi:uncharacterized protein YjbI with pentapeptide repeats
MVAWAARREQSSPAEQAAPAAPLEPAASLGGRTTGTPRTIYRPVVWTLITATVSVAGAVAFAMAIAGVEDWRLRLMVASGVLLLTGCVFVFPRLLAPPRAPADLADVQELSAKDRIQFADDRRNLQNDVRSALLQAIVGGAVLFGVLFTWQQQQVTSRQLADQLVLTRQGQVGERFSRAVGQIGSDSIDVRLGGLYELEQLAHQAADRRLATIEVVAAYIRQHARPPAGNPGLEGLPPPQDIATALTIISRRSIEGSDPPVDLQRGNLSRLNLEGADLHGLLLTSANVRDANLNRANLSGAVLGRADVRGASFVEANLRDANLKDANLRHAYLRYADLRGADLTSADLRAMLLGVDFRGADFILANLRGATISFADFRDTYLGSADFRNAHFYRADLRGAQLNETDLRDAYLVRANLRGAYLGGADLRGANLRGADLRGAIADQSTRWPHRFDWRTAGVQASRD